MKPFARGRGPVPVGSVTRSRCDGSVVAEPGSQAITTRAARWRGVPVVEAAGFLAWADR